MSSTFTVNDIKINDSPHPADTNSEGRLTSTALALEHTTLAANESVSGKLVRGIGINDLPGHTYYRDPATGKLRIQPAYASWNAMLQRAYDEKLHARNPSYIDCTVHPDWLRFSVFKAWFDQNYVPGWCLDKDLIHPGNKVYGPEHCRYVPPYINLIVTDSRATRGQWPLGVTKQARGVSFQASCWADGEQIRLGSFDCPMSAHNAWQEKKANAIDTTLLRYMKEQVVHIEVVRALMHYADRLRADAVAGRETIGFRA